MQMMDFSFLFNPMFLMVFMGGMGLFNILFAFWIYNDAISKNNVNSTLWAVIVLISGFMGLIFYFIMNSGNNTVYSKTTSPGMNRNNNYDLQSGRNRETNYESPHHKQNDFKFCSVCGTKNEHDSKFCVSCGSSF
ncbi:MAG: hypothetical protein HeimC3_48840 [Candidatus Heimdallarchaeota archaeon LC_3]|nr:MAG: hypothetical protein HeimC3_48840 [Candidatus Heimdallarchaeota archaeon LC_3]